jgi:hypothetical protein
MIGVVYFVRPVGMLGPIKIGFSSKDVHARLRQLNAQSPLPVEMVACVPGTKKLEANIHQCLADSHSHFEWFRPTDEVLAFLEKLVAGVPVVEAIDLSARRGHIRINSSTLWDATTRKKMSYVHKVRLATNRARKALGEFVYPPQDIRLAIANMRVTPLSADQEAAIIAYIADPKAHCVFPSRRAA